MKILLLGDFSAFHYNLKKGLVHLGHEVTVVGRGDGFKNIPNDIMLSSKKGLLGKLYNRFDFFRKVIKFKNYDVVQIINPFIFPVGFFPARLLFKILKKRNAKVFLVGAGDDSYFWLNARKKMKYGPFDDYLKYDLKASLVAYQKKPYFRLNTFVANNVDGIIPIMYEYWLAYSHLKNCREVIPMPMDVDGIKFNTNQPSDKITIFHGLNRYGFKGTRFVEEAFEFLSKKYPEDLELIIDGKMPLGQYLKVMEKTNVVIDQTNSYSLGMNGVYAMAMGKVVIGGAEPESLHTFGLKSSPIINVTPSSKDLVERIESILINKSKIYQIGEESRAFAKSLHCCKKVAQRYLDEWSL